MRLIKQFTASVLVFIMLFSLMPVPTSYAEEVTTPVIMTQVDGNELTFDSSPIQVSDIQYYTISNDKWYWTKDIVQGEMGVVVNAEDDNKSYIFSDEVTVTSGYNIVNYTTSSMIDLDVVDNITTVNADKFIDFYSTTYEEVNSHNINKDILSIPNYHYAGYSTDIYSDGIRYVFNYGSAVSQGHTIGFDTNVTTASMVQFEFSNEKAYSFKNIVKVTNSLDQQLVDIVSNDTHMTLPYSLYNMNNTLVHTGTLITGWDQHKFFENIPIGTYTFEVDLSKLGFEKNLGSAITIVDSTPKVDPKFRIELDDDSSSDSLDDTNPDEIKIMDRWEEYDNGSKSVGFNLYLDNSGMSYNRLIIDGVTTAEGKDPIDFVLTAYSTFGEGNYRMHFYIPEFDSKHYERPEEGFDKTHYQEAEDVDQHFQAVPVYPADKNHIRITFTDELDQEYTMEFDYYPSSKEDIIGHLYFDNNRIGPNSTTIKVNTDVFYGKPENASLVLYTEDATGQKDVATFDKLTDITPIVRVMEDFDNFSFTEYILLFQGDSANNNISELSNNTQLFGRIEYNEIYKDSNNNIVSTISPIIIDDTIEVDKDGINPHAWFESFDQETNEIIIKVETGDKAELSSIKATDAIRFTDHSGSPIDVVISRIEPIFDPSMEQEQTSFNGFKLYIPKSQLDVLELDEGINIHIDGLYDELGNVMESPYIQDLHFNTEVTLIIRDTSYKTYPGYEFWIEKVDAAEPFIRPLMTDEEGIINTWLPYGQYRIYKMIKSGDEPFLGGSVELDFEVPLMGSGIAFKEELFLPDNNIRGKASRPDDMVYTEYLAFMLDSDAAELDTLMNRIHSSEFDTYSEEEKEAYWEKEHYYRFNRTHMVKTDSEGNFELFLPEGSYQLMGRVMGYQIQEPLDGRMTVAVTDSTVQQDIGLIDFERPDYMLNLYDSTNEPIGISFINLTKTDGLNEDDIHVVSNEDGQVPLFLETGTTISLEGVENKGHGTMDAGRLYLLNPEQYTYTYDGVINTQDIILPEENVNIYLSYDGNAFEYDHWMAIMIEDAEGQLYDVGSHTGAITGFFTDGDYVIKEVHLDNEIMIVNQTFTVSGSADVPIDMSTLVNVELTLQDDSGNPISGAYLDIEIDDYLASAKTDSYGRALYIIPTDIISTGTSTLHVNGYGYSNKWYELNEEYTISALPFKKNITVNGPNFYGYVHDALGNVVFKDGWISIEKVSDASNWFGGWINDTEGKFEFVLEPGEYVVHNAGAETASDNSWMEIKYRFSVGEDGLVYDKDNNLVTMPLILSEVQSNLFGTLHNRNGSVYSDEYVSLLIKEVEADGTDYSNYEKYPWLYERWIDVDDNGNFGINVEDGNYQAIAISTDTTYIEFASPVDLVLESTNAVTPPDFTFQGLLKHYDPTSVIKYGGMGIELIGKDRWDWIGVESGGFFGKNYDNGERVKIQGVHYQLEGDESYYEFRYNKAYTIGVDDTSNILIQPNVKGIVDLGQPLEETDWMSINLRPVYDQGDFSTQEEYERYLENQWEYDIWAEMSLDENGNPTFYTLLNEGTYKIQGMHIDGNYIELNSLVIIDQLGTDDNVIYSALHNNYVIDISYVPNVYGQIRDESGTPVADSWVNLIKLDSTGDEDYNDHERWFGTKTDASGSFELSLEEGYYRLDGFHTEGQFVAGNWVQGEWTSVNKVFQIDEDGNLRDKDDNILSFLDIAPNVVGIVYYLENDVPQPLNDAWINFKPVDEYGEIIWDEHYWAGTGYGDNTFSTFLPDGDYRITDFGGSDMRYDYEDIESADFTVSEGLIISLIIQPKEPNFSGIVYSDIAMTKPLDWGWLMVKPASDAEYDWTHVRRLETDKAGRFLSSLDDGDYIIKEFGNFDYWRRVNISFNVTNGVVSGLLTDNNGVVVAPPAPSVIGQVYDKQGNLYEDDAWITVKPVDADEYDWTNAVWAQYAMEDGQYEYSLNLPEGDYKIVEVGSRDFWYRANIHITVVQGQTQTVDIVPPVPNVTGTVYATKDTSTPIGQGWINVMRVDSDGNQVTLDGDPIIEEYMDTYSEIYWQYTQGAEIEDSAFEMFLENGATYRIIAVGGYDTWYQPDMTFTVGIGSQDMIITKPGDNVTITFTNVPTSFISTTEAWMDIVQNVTGYEEYFFFDEGKVDQDNNTITFEGRLRDGDYDIRFFGTPDGDIEMNQAFTVTGITDVTINFDSFSDTVLVEGNITVNDENVTESIYIIIDDDQGGKVKVKTDNTGGFSVMLDKNTTYQINEIADKNGYASLITATEIDVLDSDLNTGTLNLQK